MNKAEQFIDALILEIENVGTGDRLFDLLARHSSRLADVVGDAPISCCDEPWGSTVLVSHPILETTVTVPERVHKDNIERLKGEVIRALRAWIPICTSYVEFPTLAAMGRAIKKKTSQCSRLANDPNCEWVTKTESGTYRLDANHPSFRAENGN